MINRQANRRTGKTFLFLLTLFCFPAFAQKAKIDSLRNVLKTQKEDTNKVNTLVLLTRAVMLTGQYDSAMIWGEQTKALAEKIGYKKGLGNAYNNIGNIYLSKGELDESQKQHSKSMEVQQEINNLPGVASSHNNLGNICLYKGNYPEALDHYLSAKKIYEQIKTGKMIRTNLASAYNNIGSVYLLQNNYAAADSNYRSGLALRLELGDKHGAAASYGNIGLVNYMLHKYDEALKNHRASLKIKEEIEDKPGIAATYGNIGTVYFDQGKYAEALVNFFASEKLGLELGNQETVANAYSNIGQTYVRLHKPAEARAYLEKSLAIGKELGHVQILKNSYDGLARADSALGNWQAALEEQKLFTFYRDSILNQENTQKITQAQMNYEFQKKQTAAQEAQAKKDAVRSVITWSGIGALVLLFLAVLLFINRSKLKQKHRHQEELNKKQKEQADAVMETQEQERKRIAEDLHDSLGHLLSTVKMNLQTFPSEYKPLTENPLNLLNQASEEIRNITFNLMPRTLEEGGLVPALNELASKVTNAGRVKVLLHVHGMDRFTLEKQSQFNIYRIVQEAVNNILKHADASEITIQLIGQDDHLRIMIEDDGKGFDPGQQKSGRGLKNIVTRSLWLKGNINIDSHPGRGTTITTEIPV